MFRKKPEPVLLSVAAVIGGQFKFPPGCQLVSGLILISFPERSQKKVTIVIEHYVCIEDLPHNKKLQFISSVLEFSLRQVSLQFNKRGKFLTNKAVWDTPPCS